MISRTSRTLAIAGLTAVAAAAAGSPAQAASLDLKATCKYPLVGVQPVDLSIQADIPVDLPIDYPTARFPVRATVTSNGSTSVPALAAGAHALTGSMTLEPSLHFPSGFVQPFALPLTVDRWVRPDTGVPNPFVFTAKGSTPSLVLDELGTTAVMMGDRFDLNLTLSDDAGVPIRVRPLVDYEGEPFVDSDGNPDTFDVRCKVDAGQALKLTSIVVPLYGGADTTPPSKPSEQSQLPGDVDTSSANLRWGASVDEPGGSGLRGYRIYTEEGVIDVPATATSHRVTGLAEDTEYMFRITAVDAAGNESEALEVLVLVLHNDAFGITPPTDLVLVGPPTAESVQLRWTKPARNAERVASYNVYNGGALVKKVVGESALITGLAASTPYTFTVEAVDFNGERSERSAPLVARTADAGETNQPQRRFSIAGTSQLKTLTKGSVPIAGELRADVVLATGQVSADLALKPTQGRLTALGFIPVTAKVAFVTSGKTTGLLNGDRGLTTKSLVRIKLPEVKLFGAVPLAGGNNCQTKSLSTIDLKSTGAFNLSTGGTLAGTFAISDLNGCGVLNGLVSPLTAGGGNAISLQLTALSDQ